MEYELVSSGMFAVSCDDTGTEFVCCGIDMETSAVPDVLNPSVTRNDIESYP